MSVETFQSPKLRMWFVTVQPSVLARRPSNGCKLWPCCVNVKKSPLKRSFALFWTNSQKDQLQLLLGRMSFPSQKFFFWGGGNFLGRLGNSFFWGQFLGQVGFRDRVPGKVFWAVGWLLRWVGVWWWLWGHRFWLEAWYSMIYKNGAGKQLVFFSCRYTDIPSTPEECHHLQRNHKCLWWQWSMATCFAALCRLQHNIETQHCDLQRSDSVEFF